MSVERRQGRANRRRFRYSSPDPSGGKVIKNHTVIQGECLSSIAEEHGFFWETLWNHPDNKKLQELRRDPNILSPGDVVFIPDKRVKEVSEPTNQLHKFRVKNAPAKLKLRLLRGAEPRAGEPYVLIIDDVEIKRDKIPPDGTVEVSIPPRAKQGRLVLGAGESAETYVLQLGHLDPLEALAGVKARLNSLGFDCGKPNDEMNEQTSRAIADFQAYINHAEPNGQLDATTREALGRLHDELNS